MKLTPDSRGGTSNLTGISHGNPAEVGRRRLVLIADDETPIRMVVGEKLRSCGFEVMDAPDGEAALELALSRRPDLIVTDLQMPFMSGLDLANKIADNASTRGVPIILLTARGHVLDEPRLEATTIRHIMAKPFSARELVNVIESVLNESAAGAARLSNAA